MNKNEIFKKSQEINKLLTYLLLNQNKTIEILDFFGNKVEIFSDEEQNLLKRYKEGTEIITFLELGFSELDHVLSQIKEKKILWEKINKDYLYFKYKNNMVIKK